MNITDVCIRRPVFAWMIMAATVLFGLVALRRIGVSQYPDVDFPTISVNATWEGAAPDVMESEVVEILEEALMQVEGVRSVTSSARQGSASVTIELPIERDIDLAMQDVQTRLAQAQRRLPLDMDPPTASKTNPEDQPIMWVGLSGPYPRSLLTDTAQYQIKEKLQTIPGVGEVTLGGFLERNVRIWLDAAALARHHLTPNDVLASLQREHVERPAGRIDAAGREISVRVLGEAFDLPTLREIVVAEQNGAPIRLRDVALVEDGFEDERRISRSLGFPVQGIGVRKQRGANAVAVAQAVRAELTKINTTLPDGMTAAIAFDSARFIEDTVHHIELELVMAVVLTALVCWMFLGSLSSTLNVVMAIPMSLLGTIAAIFFLGFTLNTFTLLALSLAVGIVVDDAIMVMENIYRHAEMGKPKEQAAREGTAEITFAALAATIAVVAIFIPVVFLEGVLGKYFLQFGVTLSIAVLLSYIEAITLAPARCAQFLRAGRHDRSALGRLVDDAFSGLARNYRWLLTRALRYAWVVLLIAVASVAGLVYAFKALPGEMVPSQDQSRLQVRMFTEVGNSLAETDKVFKQAEEYINSQPEVARTMANVGGFGGGGGNVSQVQMMVSLVPKRERDVTQAEFAQRLRKNLSGIAGLRVSVQDPSQSGFTANNRGYPIELSVRGPDWPTLVGEAMRLRDELAATGMVMDVDTDYELGMPELRMLPKRELASDLGISIDDIATAVNTMIGGVRAGKYSSNGRRVDVRVKVRSDQRSSPDALAHLYLRSRTGDMISLATLVTLEERPALQSITRRDRERAITITANVAPGHSQQEVLADVRALQDSMPPGYKVVLAGASASFLESFAGLAFAFLIGVAVAYMVLASQFNSFLHPVTVLTILPLSMVGALFALLFSGNSLNIFSMIGLLLLAGIVKKNSIILVEYANHGRDRGLDARAAMIEAGPTRLRPILMTSIATMVAALPAALGLGEGSETRTPMAIAVIGGLVVSTALSLFVVPAFYVVADSIRSRIFRSGPDARVA